MILTDNTSITYSSDNVAQSNLGQEQSRGLVLVSEDVGEGLGSPGSPR
jgi:hypothetical protein